MRRFIPFLKKPPVVAVLRLQGVIASGSRGNTLNAAGLASAIERAFRKGKPKAVALVVNSPGGSPVQSALIAAHIRRLSDELEIPVHAFVEDVAASGGYWLACAGDHIWIDQSSIVGSIGVISASFGFHELLERQGVERRVYTAGEDKSMLDPFRPTRPEDVERLKALQGDIHRTFIEYVQERRGTRLLGETNLFTGEIWVGERASDLGLVDGIGHLVPKMKSVFGEKTRFVHYGQRRTVLSKFGLTLDGLVQSQLEDRALWARYGL